MEGLCLVVSPLISLMKDQVQHLRDKGIKAACLVSGTTSYEQSIVLNNCIHGNVKILYVSPERLRQRVFIEHFRQMKVSMIAVDEAHCISQWGYDFRPPYLEIARIRQYCPDVPIIALTATATPLVAEDIQRQLLFRKGCRFFQSSFSRPNLAYMVFRETDKLGRLLRIARKVGGSGIVYVRNRRRTKEVADFLTSQGIPAAFYHAGLEPRDRDLSQKQWMNGALQVMVATNAFGMGIDKPDVRYVVHLDIPASVEAYFQEAGRAGRDGNKAYAVLLYDNSDLDSLQHSFETAFPSRQQISNVYRAICNYYQLPIGSGCDCQFDFDLEALCNTYHFNVAEFYSATRFLEREGLLSIPEKQESQSQIYVPISKEDLYRFQVEQHRYGELLSLMLRMYGGVFSGFEPISERAIARRVYMEEDRVVKMLLHMDALKVIVYKPKTTKPQIFFTAPRTDVKDIYLSDTNYKDLKQSAEERLEAIRQYVLTDEGCRSQYLLKYFGETQSTPCGSCDLCLISHQKEKRVVSKDRVVELLKTRPMRADELCAEMGEMDEAEVRNILREMVDEGKVSINKSLQFFV